MRMGCFHGWVFVLGFDRPIPEAIIDSALHRVLAPTRGVC
jgi:hypothetical protein